MTGLLLWGDTVRSAALRHEIPLAIIDAVLFAEVDGRRVVLTSWLERDRVTRALPDAEVLDFFDFGWKDLIASGMSVAEAEREVVTRVVRRLGIGEAIVPGDFPLALGDRLRDGGIVLTVDDDAVGFRRRAKSGVELDGVLAAQRAAEAGMTAVRRLLSRARPIGNGHLQLDGKPLLAEDVRAALRAACAEHGAACPPDVIVGSVLSGSGHEPGSGPLPTGLPIVVDLWPQHEASGCWADMTRTFVVGRPHPEHAGAIAESERLVGTALERAKAAVHPGVTGRELFDLVCDLFESKGRLTRRTAQRDGEVEGFQFSLGHGVGLEVHEAPGLGPAGRDSLVEGDVLAIEPGLSSREIGEVRLEDLVLVTMDGCETLTRFPYDLAPSRQSARSRE